MRFLLIYFFLILCFFQYGQIPSFLWAKNFGGQNSVGQGKNVKIDAFGSTISTGNFGGTIDFDPNPGVFTLTSSGLNNDVFISKLDAFGNFVWAKSIGSIESDVGLSLSLDNSGNIYVCGIYSLTTDFDPGPGAFFLTPNGGTEIFILKLDTDGNFLWAKTVGGVSNDFAYCLINDSFNNVLISGQFIGTVDFDPGIAINNLNGVGDAFVLKLDNNGNFLWAKSFGGLSGGARADGICVDSNGDIVFTGAFSGSVDFDPDLGNNIINSTGGSIDSYVCKLNTSGNLLWAKNLGGNNDDAGFSIAIDANSNILTTGFFKGIADFDPNAGVSTLSASTIRGHIYVSKLDITGNYVWAKGFVGNGAGGSPKDNIGRSISVDADGNVLTTGRFEGDIDFDPGAGMMILSSFNNYDIFISKLTSSGDFVWVGQVGGPGWDEATSIYLGSNGSINLTGSFTGAKDFDPDLGNYILNSSPGSTDIFILKMAPCCAGFDEYDQNKKFISVYPNPNRGEFSIVVPEEEKNVRVVLYNLMGQIVFTQALNSGINSIQTKLSKGLYLARLQGDTFTSEAAKVIVE